MKQRVLVSGSEGFIGQHVVNKLLALGHEVVGVDHLDPQVHGCTDNYARGPYQFHRILVSVVPPVYGDFDSVIHLGAKVGVGQSMYQISQYVHDNTMETAKMLGTMAKNPPKRLIVASSMSIYGEGEYNTKGNRWPNADYEPGAPIPTTERYPPDLRSIYALTKYDQEQLCLIWGKAYDVPTVALRFFNTYGPGQSLNNPYTGVMAIFASRLLNDKPPVIYEDGLQSRDFIHVDDVANAVVHAATTDMPSGAYNVGTGVATTIQDVAHMMEEYLGKDIKANITGQHRKGDIRHCFADIAKIKATGWEPKIPFAEGIMEYCAWLRTQPKPEDKFDQAHAELVEKGLTK